MKKYFFTLLAACLLSLFSIASPVKPFVVKGNITNNFSKSIIIGDSSVSVSPTGSFEYSFDISFPAFCQITLGQISFPIYAVPGEVLSLSFDSKDYINTIKYEGATSQKNYFLLKQEVLSQQVNQFLNANWANIFSKKEERFIGTIDSLKTLFVQRIDSLASQEKGDDSTFSFLNRNNVVFSFNKLLLIYPQQFQRFTGDKSNSQTIEKHLQKINLDNKEYMQVDEYISFGKLWLDKIIREELERNEKLKTFENRSLNAAFYVINQRFKSKEVRAFWNYQFLNKHIENYGISSIESYIDLFNKTSSNEEQKDRINNLYNREKEGRNKALVKTYKQVNGTDLRAFIFMPDDVKEKEPRPAMVYFHGGSWSEGKPDWHFGSSSEGFINISVDYRIYDRHGALPFEGVADAKSFFRWLRKNASELHIDTSKIIATGNSAGAHLALSAAMLDSYDDPKEDLSVSSKPNLLILNAGVYDLSQWMWFDELVKDKEKVLSISPFHHIKTGLIPMLVFHGTNDYSVPFQTATNFVAEMKQAGNPVEFYPIQNTGHELWFNQDYHKIFDQTSRAFLKKYGCL